MLNATRLGARSVVRSATRARKQPTPTGFNAFRSPLSRRYASSDSSQRPGSASSNSLVSAAAGGFAAGLIFVLVRRWGISAEDATTKCDGAPALNAIETYGKSWVPYDALEKDDPQNPMRIRMATWVKELQDHIVKSIEALEASAPIFTPQSSSGSSAGSFGLLTIAVDPSTTSSTPPTFHRDSWIRPQGGEGRSCVLKNGRVFEKAGVNVSIVHGKLPPAGQKAMKSEHSSVPISDTPLPYFATGLSIVLHPWNPHVPTVHLNYRYFEIGDPDPKTDEPIAWWFGGGSDLTPTYLVESDAKHFHQTLKSACDAHNPAYWPRFKKWCDEYFYIPHRKESRGVGGIFFDDLTTSAKIHDALEQSGRDRPTQEELFGFVKSASSAFLPGYLPIVKRNMGRSWTEQERRWQLLRRGRYVEFNLVNDRGTKFGLATPGARIESVLMSLPESARWEYMTDMGAEGTEEGKLMDVLRKPREWV